MSKIVFQVDQSKLIEQLFAEIKQLKERMSLLEKENTILRQKLSKYENPKNSRNSSIPPSKDENRPLKTKSLREQTDRKVGGQKGHEGNTLKMTKTPDEIINYVPDFCCECGHDLQGVIEEFVGKRQVVDIPIIKPQFVEHRIYRRICNCGHSSCASYPQNVNASISYGANTESLVGYLYSRQYVPFHRMREFFNDAFSLPISEGGIHELLKRLANKAMPAYNMIKEKVETSKVVGADETGAKINGKKSWFWTWQNDKLTYITPSENRGFITSQHWAMTLLLKHGFQAFIIDYSGYGFSEGKATRKKILEDGNSALAYILSRPDVEGTNIVLYGQSLGGHLATVVAAQNQDKINALVVEGAFSSHKDIGTYFAGFLGKVLVKEHYSAIESVQNFNKPILIIHSTEDRVIPFEMGQKIYENANAPKSFFEIEGCHICGSRIYNQEISERIHKMLED